MEKKKVKKSDKRKKLKRHRKVLFYFPLTDTFITFVQQFQIGIFNFFL